jgi:hypothetical protein
LGLCVVGLIAIAAIAVMTGGRGIGSTSPNQETPFSTIPPTLVSTIIDPSSLPTDTNIPPTNVPTILPTAVPTITPTRIPTSTNTPACGAKYPSRLQPNRDAGVCTSKAERLIIREYASLSAPEIFRIYTGEVIHMLEGPICADDFWWWKVNIYSGTPYGFDTNIAPTWNPMGTTEQTVSGWAREGWDTTDPYFICPLPNP